MKTKDLAQRRRRVQDGARKRRADPPAAGAECEIKLGVPDAAWTALAKEMSGPDVRILPLHAVYQDLPGRELARAAMALRVRREAGGWVQTLKAPGEQAIERLEDEVVLGRAGGEKPPAADLRRHRSPAAQAALRSALGLARDAALPAVHPVFEVRVQRRTRRVTQGRSVIELALDEGQLLAGDRSAPVRELELELVSGSVRDLLALARRWRARWGLWLSTASKAARGDLLARGEPYGPAVGATAPKLPSGPRMGPFAAAVLQACLDQVMANATAVAAGSQDEDHVHQLRVGLRRLRTALAELPVLAADRQRLEPALSGVFRALGEQRDRTHVLGAIEPLVEAAGGLPLRLPSGFHEGPDPGALVRGAAFQDAMLALLERAEQLRASDEGPVRRVVRERLARLHRQAMGDGRRFTHLSDDDQHRVRKRLKRLRYLGEFAAPLFPAKAVAHYLAELKPAQDVLGHYNDEIMAEGLYQELAGTDPGAEFGVRWLRERRAGEAKACRQALRKLEKVQPFWVGR